MMLLDEPVLFVFPRSMIRQCRKLSLLRMAMILIAAGLLQRYRTQVNMMWTTRQDVFRQVRLSASSSFGWATVNGTTMAEAAEPTIPPSDNKTLVIVMGNLRCGEQAWATLKQNVLDVNQADLALMLGDIAPQYQNSSLLKRARFVWRFQEHSDWGNALDNMEQQERQHVHGTQESNDNNNNNMSIPSWRITIWPRLRQSVAFGGVKNSATGCCTGGGAPQYVARYHIQQQIRKYDLLQHYTRFVIARSDSYYKFQVNLNELDDNYIWVPYGCQDGCDFGGLNDRHMIVSRQHVMRALDGFPAMVRSDGRNYTDADININPEGFLLQTLRRGGLADRVKRFPQPFYTCIAAGDQKSWQARPMLGEDGVYVKKPREYNPVKGRCRREPLNCKKGKLKEQA